MICQEDQEEDIPDRSIKSTSKVDFCFETSNELVILTYYIAKKERGREMIRFTKMQGLGNDYVYVDTIHQKIQNVSSLAKLVSNRHWGIGADGLILIDKSEIADFKMRMFNPDGSQSEMCGNGIRRVGKFVYEKGLTTKKDIIIETLAGIKKLKLNVQNGKVENVRVDMGEPILEADKIPVVSNEKQRRT